MRSFVHISRRTAVLGAASLFLGLLAGCTAPAVDSAAADKLEASLPGVYEGRLPCADCAGIQTALFLKATGTYTRVSHYIDANGAFEEAGSWHAQISGPAADAAGGAVVVFEPISSADRSWTAKIEPDGSLRLTDAAGEPVSGPDADRWVLTRS